MDGRGKGELEDETGGIQRSHKTFPSKGPVILELEDIRVPQG